MTLEELTIVYQADVQPALDALSRLAQALLGTGAQADALAQDFYTAGVQAGQGLSQGITDSREQVIAAAREVASAAAAALRSALEIHSPSAVTGEMGTQFTNGLTQGMLASAVPALDAVRGLSKAPQVPGVFQSVARQDEQPLHITVPIEVDGYQLGVAAIEGIHRVSRVSGRAELTL